MEGKLLHCRSCVLWQRVSKGLNNQSRSRHSIAKGKLSKKNHYDVLGLKPNASTQDIRAAFVNLSKEIHPDRNPTDPLNHDKFVQLNEAYTVLSRLSSRRDYDVSLVFQRQQTVSRNAYGSHTAGESHHPGSGTAQGTTDESSERVFWDETIWYMRDRSKDAGAYYAGDSYYGIKGVRRLPNSYILAGCLVLMVIGSISFVAAWRWSARKRQTTLDLVDRKNLALLDAARARAKALGTAKQLELMTAKWNSNKPEPPTTE